MAVMRQVRQSSLSTPADNTLRFAYGYLTKQKNQYGMTACCLEMLKCLYLHCNVELRQYLLRTTGPFIDHTAMLEEIIQY